MTTFTLTDGDNFGTNDDDIFFVPEGIGDFSLNAGGGNDELRANISFLEGLSWNASQIEEFTFFGSSSSLFTLNLNGSVEADTSQVTSLAFVTVESGTGVVINGNDNTAVGFSFSLEGQIVSQSFDFASGRATAELTDGSTVSFATTNVSMFLALPASTSVFSGSDGNDTLLVRDGTHSFNGGAGVDTFIVEPETFNATNAQFVATSDSANDTLSVTTTIPDLEFLASGTDVERVAFLDSSQNITETRAYDVGAGENAGMAYRLYQAAFDRTPDNDGLKFWVNAIDDGLDIRAAANSFVTSEEFAQTYGELSNAEFVDQMYLNVLDRAGEAEGVAFWNGVLNDNSASRADVLFGFSESQENIVGVAPSISDGIVIL